MSLLRVAVLWLLQWTTEYEPLIHPHSRDPGTQAPWHPGIKFATPGEIAWPLQAEAVAHLQGDPLPCPLPGSTSHFAFGLTNDVVGPECSTSIRKCLTCVSLCALCVSMWKSKKTKRKAQEEGKAFSSLGKPPGQGNPQRYSRAHRTDVPNGSSPLQSSNLLWASVYASAKWRVWEWDGNGNLWILSPEKWGCYMGLQTIIAAPLCACETHWWAPGAPG